MMLQWMGSHVDPDIFQRGPSQEVPQWCLGAIPGGKSGDKVSQKLKQMQNICTIFNIFQDKI